MGELLEGRWQSDAEGAPDYTGRVTVPLLWETQRQTIVGNESADTIVMLNAAFETSRGRRSILRR